FHQWVALAVTAAGGGALDRDELISRMTDARKIDRETAEEAITELTAAELVEIQPEAETGVRLTPAGKAKYDQIRESIDEVVAHAYGDLPAEDLATAYRVL